MSDDFIELDDYLADNEDLVRQRVAIKEKIAELHRVGWPIDRIAGYLRLHFSSTQQYSSEVMLSRVESEVRQLTLHRPIPKWEKLKAALRRFLSRLNRRN